MYVLVCGEKLQCVEKKNHVHRENMQTPGRDAILQPASFSSTTASSAEKLQ